MALVELSARIKVPGSGFRAKQITLDDRSTAAFRTRELNLSQTPTLVSTTTAERYMVLVPPKNNPNRLHIGPSMSETGLPLLSSAVQVISIKGGQDYYLATASSTASVRVITL